MQIYLKDIQLNMLDVKIYIRKLAFEFEKLNLED